MQVDKKYNEYRRKTILRLFIKVHFTYVLPFANSYELSSEGFQISGIFIKLNFIVRPKRQNQNKIRTFEGLGVQGDMSILINLMSRSMSISVSMSLSV